MYKIISFDFDRTMAHVNPLSQHIIPELLNKRGFNVEVEHFKKICEAIHANPPEHLFERYHKFGLMPPEEQFQFNKEYNFALVKKLDLPGNEEENDKIIRSVIDEVKTIQKKILYEDTKSTIQKLVQMGMKLYVMSGNHSDIITEILKENQILQHFEEIITVNKYSQIKSENFQVLLDHSKIHPREILHIGDDVDSDGLGAKKFNIDSIIIRRDSQLVYDNDEEHQFPIITKFDEIFDYLKSKNEE